MFKPIPTAVEITEADIMALYTGPTRVYMDGVLLPVAPDKIKIPIKNKNETIDLASGESLKILNRPGLTEYMFELLIPDKSYDWALYEGGFKPAQYYLDLFEKLKNPEKGIFRFLVISGTKNVSQICTLEDYEILNDAEEVGDLRVSIKLEKYVYHITEKLKIVTKDDGSKVAVLENEMSQSNIRQLVDGYVNPDTKTYGAFALKNYGNFDLGDALMKLNGASQQNITGKAVKVFDNIPK